MQFQLANNECMAPVHHNHFIDTVVTVSTAEAAEMTKILENTFRSVNIGLVNEMAIMCDKLNIDVWEVIRAASTKPFGYMPFFPGPGLGGRLRPLGSTVRVSCFRLRGLGCFAAA